MYLYTVPPMLYTSYPPPLEHGKVTSLMSDCVTVNRFNVVLAELRRPSHSTANHNRSIVDHSHSIAKPQPANCRPVPSIVETRPLYLISPGSFALLVQDLLPLTSSTHAAPRRSIRVYGPDRPTDKGKEERQERKRPSDSRLKSFLYLIAYPSLDFCIH